MRYILLVLTLGLVACGKSGSGAALPVNALGASSCSGEQLGSWTDEADRVYEIKSNCTIEIPACETVADYNQPSSQGVFQLLVPEGQGGHCFVPGKSTCALAFTPSAGYMYFSCGSGTRTLTRQ